jgi:hypothetical protein
MCARQGALKYTLGDTTTNSIMHNNQQYDARTRPHVMHTQGHTNTNSTMHTHEQYHAHKGDTIYRTRAKQRQENEEHDQRTKLLPASQNTPTDNTTHTRPAGCAHKATHDTTQLTNNTQQNQDTTCNRANTQHTTELTHNIQPN